MLLICNVEHVPSTFTLQGPYLQRGNPLWLSLVITARPCAKCFACLHLLKQALKEGIIVPSFREEMKLKEGR